MADNVLEIGGPKKQQPSPVCPFCNVSAGHLVMRHESVGMPAMISLTTFCANPECQKILTMEHIPAQWVTPEIPSVIRH
jgi:hypothetical protein